MRPFITTTSTTTLPPPPVEFEFISIAGTDPAYNEIIKDVILKVARQLGDHAPLDVTVVSSTDQGALVDAFRRVNVYPNESVERVLTEGSGGGVYVNGVMFVVTTDTQVIDHVFVMFKGIAAHEYYHHAQSTMSGGRSGDAAPWMTEGAAILVEMQYAPPGEWLEDLDLFHWNGIPWPGMRALEDGDMMLFGKDGEVGYYVEAGQLIAEYTELSGLTSDAWMFDLWLALNEHSNWRAAWEHVYGTTVDEFYTWADTRMEAVDCRAMDTCAS